MAEVTLKKKMSGKFLARNTLLNLIGQAAPLLVALFSIPFLIKGMGTDRFGMLTIVWMIIGYFSFFDLGIGRALIQLISEKIGDEKQEELPPLIWTASALLLIFGIVGSLVVYFLSNILVTDFLKVPPSLLVEANTSMIYIAISIPVVILSTAWRGILEAFQRFDLVNYIRIPMGIFNYLGPLVVVFFTQSLSTVVLVLVIGRMAFWVLNIFLCKPVMPTLLSHISFHRKAIKPLISFGGWMTVSNVIGPLMSYMDRFIIGYILSITVVAYYTTPYEMVNRLAIIPSALVTSLFPTFGLFYKTDPARVKKYYYRGLDWSFILLFPFIILILAFSREGLGIWIDPQFAEHSYRVLQILAVGILLNGIGYIPFALIQGCGRPDLTAKIHFIEFIVYGIMIFFFIHWYGIEGAALVWTIRTAMDTTLMLLFARGFFKQGEGSRKKQTLLTALLIIASLVLFINFAIYIKVLLLLLLFGIFVYVVWFHLLGLEDRDLVKNKMARLSKRGIGD